MTDAEKLEAMRRHSAAFADAMVPLLGENGKGLLMARIFYVIAHPDGTDSGGQIGICQAEEFQGAANGMMIGYLTGAVEHLYSGMVEKPKRN